MTPGEIIRAARREAGVTQATLARRLGRSQASVAALEAAGSNPTFATVEDALATLGFRLEAKASRHASSIDETLVARNLRMSPAERLAAFETAHAEVETLRRAVQGHGGA